MKRAVALVALLAACGDGTAARSDGEARYVASATVLDAGDGPMLCLAGVAESLPPQCSGPPIDGWDWAEVEDEESASGTTWGEYEVVGTWDGRRFGLVEVRGPARHRAPDPHAFDSPCPEPPGGWAPVDEATTTEAALGATLQRAHDLPGYAGGWLDQSVNPAWRPGPFGQDVARQLNDPRQLVLNIRVVGDVEAAERSLRETWGGALCVSPAERTVQQLEDLRRAAEREVRRRDLEVLGSSVDEVAGAVHLFVVVAPDAVRDGLDERFGAGAVVLDPALRPA